MEVIPQLVQVQQTKKLQQKTKAKAKSKAKVTKTTTKKTLSLTDPIDVTSWGEQQVLEWLEREGLSPSTREVFRSNEIRGDVLLELVEDEIKMELGVRSLGERKRLMKALRRLRKGECSAA
jgi:hypothetical protein